MNSTILVAIIGLFGSTLAASITYWLSKKKEREADTRKEKIAFYKSFLDSLSGVLEGNATPEGHIKYASATNNLLLFSPQYVIDAVQEFREETKVSNTSRSWDKHQKLLARMLLAIRKDIGVSPKDIPELFSPILWGP